MLRTPRGSREGWAPGYFISARAALFQSHWRHHIRFGSDKVEYRRQLANFGKIGIFAQEAVTRMDVNRLRDFRGVHHGGRCRDNSRVLATDANGFVGEPDRQAMAIGFPE